MSLLSLNNFVTPLTNKIHIITIILVAILFALYRLAGGGWSVIPTKPRIPSYNSSASGNSADFDKMFANEDAMFETPSVSSSRKADTNKDKNKVGKTTVTVPLNSEQENLVKKILGDDSKKSETRPQRDSSGLEDIEKKLGLR